MIGPISSVPQLTMRDSTVQKMYKTADGQTKIVNYYAVSIDLYTDFN